MEMVDIIKQRCNEKGITIAKLERDLDFSNGYIGKLKNGNIPIDRAKAIANYLNISPEKLLGLEDDVRNVYDIELRDMLNEVADFSGCEKIEIVNDRRLRRLMKYYLLMSEANKEFIDKYVDVFEKIEKDKADGTN